MYGNPCVLPGCSEHLLGPNRMECSALTESVTAPGNTEPSLVIGLGQVDGEDTVVVTVWTGGEDADAAFEEPGEAREFAARLRRLADQLDRDASLLERLRAGAGVA
ncbi:hypothetical protein [Kitasatospora sp. NBC_01302]|uniref:hypothetical protein n=1 Tax=Kitasatospora sp. NBC_01302 TaxID=2903575 RepID=UPI002E0D26DD|nr:hypothetical protein OG294_27885 [Kitasatospora sp. NBC_01302]